MPSTLLWLSKQYMKKERKMLFPTNFDHLEFWPRQKELVPNNRISQILEDYLSYYLLHKNKFYNISWNLKRTIGLLSRMFTNGPGDRGSIPGWFIPKNQKIVLNATLQTLSIIKYGSRVKWSNSGNRVSSSSTLRCGSYWKGSLWFTLD